jgi:hypothetical protein
VFIKDKLLHSCTEPAGLPLSKPQDIVPPSCYYDPKAKEMMEDLLLGPSKAHQACGPYQLDIVCRPFPPPQPPPPPREWPAGRLAG